MISKLQEELAGGRREHGTHQDGLRGRTCDNYRKLSPSFTSLGAAASYLLSKSDLHTVLLAGPASGVRAAAMFFAAAV